MAGARRGLIARHLPVWHLALLAAALVAALLGSLSPRARAEEQSPYRVVEFPIRVAPGIQVRTPLDYGPAISGKWVIWRENLSDLKRIWGRNLETGQDFSFATGDSVVWPVDVGGDIVVAAETNDDPGYGPFPRVGMFGYRLPDGQRFTIAPLKGGEAPFVRNPPRTDGKTVVWAEGAGAESRDIYGYDLAGQRLFAISTDPADQDVPVVAGNFVVWQDRRHAPRFSTLPDIYGYDIASGQEFRITTRPELVSAPEVSGGLALWYVWRGPTISVMGYDIAKRQEFTLTELPGSASPRTLDADGDIAVWTEGYDDVIGYDLKQEKRFVISRAIGGQMFPRISGKTVVWLDSRRSGASDPAGAAGPTAQREYDVYGARLEPGPAPVPPVIGAPEAVDAKIEIVWPHDYAPVEQAKLANVSAMLFAPGTLLAVPPDWNPTVRLYRSLNNEVSREVAIGVKRIVRTPGMIYPVWDFNDVDVSAANDPANKYYFTIAVDGITTFTNVWAHGADARTYFPQMDAPTKACTGS